MTDMKYEIQMIAETIAEEKYHTAYDKLDEESMWTVYNEAEEEWNNKQVSSAEARCEDR